MNLLQRSRRLKSHPDLPLASAVLVVLAVWQSEALVRFVPAETATALPAPLVETPDAVQLPHPERGNRAAITEWGLAVRQRPPAPRSSSGIAPPRRIGLGPTGTAADRSSAERRFGALR
ncbi:MAG: hypothetical protein AAF907_17515, partial [Planctomycetota bacterium]